MAAEPLDWITWWEARDRMPEICDEWRYLSSHADQAMANSLRRGDVPYRGTAYKPGRTKPIDLRDVVAGLLSLRTHPSLFAYEAEYEATEWQTVPMPFGGWQQRPVRVKRTAILDNAELAWDEFRDDLIQRELPRGATPLLAPQDDAAAPVEPSAQRRRGPKPGTTGFNAADRALFPTIKRMLKNGGAPSVDAAARILAEEGKVAGRGSIEARATRLARHYGKWKSATTPEG